MPSDKDLGEFYYNTRTHMVERGRLSPWEHLIGPYFTHAEAERALEIAKARTADWDEDDAAWKGEENHEAGRGGGA